MSQSQTTFNEKTLLDYAARIGINAVREGIEKSQIEQLVATLEEEIEDQQLIILIPAAFAHRQVNRGKFRKRTAKWISKAMEYLYNSNCGKEEARRLLNLAKWVYQGILGKISEEKTRDKKKQKKKK